MPIEGFRLALIRIFSAVLVFAVLMGCVLTLGYLVVRADLRNRATEWSIRRRREEHREILGRLEDLAGRDEDLARRVAELVVELRKCRDLRP